MLVSYYLQFLAEICEGVRPVPAGMTLTATDEAQRALELQGQISAMGIPAFVGLCAQEAGLEIPQEAYDSFDESALLDALRQLPAEEAPAPKEEVPAEPVKTEIRDIYEVFLDSVCLEDQLVAYLMDILKRGARDEFQKLSHAAARTLLDMEDFLAWLGNKELLGTVDEQACVRIIDTCFQRLWQEGQKELLAALLSGDEKTFLIFRCQAPELQHIPEASYDWFCRYYLDGYYPLRFLMKCNGVVFPIA